jgi:hypothetical protein
MYAEKIKRNQNLLESNEYANGAPLKGKPSDMESFETGIPNFYLSNFKYLFYHFISKLQAL